MRILIAEDDVSLSAAVAFTLRTINSFAVHCVRDGEAVLDALDNENYCLLVLDLGLPRLNGFDVLRELRARNHVLPVLIMSGRRSPDDKVRGLDLGADDYIVKPFSIRELEARVRALLRRSNPQPSPTTSQAGLSFDSTSRTASFQGKVLPLSGREVSVLALLLQEFGRVVSKDQIIARIYCGNELPGPNAVEVFIHRLRKKLAPAPVEVRTFHGIGYLLDHRQ